MIHVILRISKKLVLLFKQKRTLLYAGVYIVCLWTIATILFHFIERVSLIDSLYWAVTTTTTVGYGDITPKTVLGKMFSMLVMIGGIGVLGLFLASIADILIEQSLRRRRMKVDVENHVLVLGWDKKLEIAIKELLSEGERVVAIAEVDEIPLEHKNLIFIKGDPTDEENLKRGCVKKAKFSLISGKNDTETLLAAIAVKKMNENVQVTCVVEDPKVMKALKNIKVDQALSIDEFFGLALSRSVFAPKISVFLNEIMSTKGMDVYQQRIPEFEGKIFFELMKELKEKKNAILLGIVKNGNVILNPPKDSKIEKDDEIIYIAESKIKV